MSQHVVGRVAAVLYNPPSQTFRTPVVPMERRDFVSSSEEL
jgi:hypothetical protein